MTLEDRIASIHRTMRGTVASANVLFEKPDGPGLGTRTEIHRGSIDSYRRLLRAICGEIETLAVDESSARRYVEVIDSHPDSIDFLNRLAGPPSGRSFARALTECLWDAVRPCLPSTRSQSQSGKYPHLSHTLAHASRLFESGLAAPAAYFALLAEIMRGKGRPVLPRANPAGLGEFDNDDIIALAGPVSSGMIDRLREGLKSRDAFARGRTYRPVHDELLPGTLGDIRSLGDFYGYLREKEFFEAHFAPFLAGEKVPPLLVTGVPGVGKTQLTIAFALSMPEVILVNAGPEHLEAPFERLMTMLDAHPYRRFIVFFDDLDPDSVDWSTFRNQVDGFLPYPRNTAIVLATNSRYPARILSRCKAFALRPMGPEVCKEFVADYLNEHRWMSQPYPNLVSTVASDFASMFKRGVLNDLTPRSLIRYFETLENDKDKIRSLVRESLEEIVRVPPEEAFTESNRIIVERIETERRERLGLGPAPRPEPVLRPFFGPRGPTAPAENG